MGSTRLPGKVLVDLCGHPVLYHIIKRVQQAEYIDRILVATSTSPEDDQVANYCQSIGIDCFRGSECNVLSRYFYAAKAFNIGQEDVIVRLTADNPLVDPRVLDDLLAYFKQCKYSYANTSGFPLGIGGEAFTFSALKDAFENAAKHYEKEHVTPYMYREGCTIGQLISMTDDSRFRFTMDTAEDYEFVRRVYSALYHGTHDFYLKDILDFLEKNPDVIEINAHIHQKKVMEE